MGSGDRFSLWKISGLGLGIFFDRFPHRISITIQLIKFGIYIGIGKGYDE